MDIGGIIRNAGHSVSFAEADGNVREVWADSESAPVRVTAEVESNAAGRATLKLVVRNVGAAPVKLGEAAVLDISARRGGVFALGGGGTSWTMLNSPLSDGVKDLCDLWFDSRKQDFYSDDYALIGCRGKERYAMLGFLSFARQRAKIHLKMNETGFSFERLRAICDFSGATLAPGQNVETETLYIDTASAPKAAMNAYVDKIRERTPDVPREFKNIIGWATWDYYQERISENDILENLQWLRARGNSLPVRYIQLDAGFQIREGDWLKANEKFPHGLKWLADTIREAGFVPGLWLCPFLVAPESEVYRAHPDWVLRNASGAPLRMSGYAVSVVYGLDCSIPEVLDWLRDLARQVTIECGFKYVKLDGANGQILSELGRSRDPSLTLGEAAARGLAAFRGAMCPEAFLLNAFRPCFSIGLCDGMRVGDDVGGRWDATKIAKHHGERDRFDGPGEVARSVAAIMNHFYFHKKVWVNDPDYLVVRQEGSNSELSYEEARSWASIVGMSDGLAMVSDKMPELRPERVELLEKVLPRYKKAAEPVDFFRKNVPSFYALDAETDGDAWKVLCVVNADYPARTRDYELKLTELGLAPDKDYCLFDFWDRRYLGTVRETLQVRELAAHDCRVLRISAAADIPQIVGSDMHISQGGLEIERVTFDGKELRVKTSTLGRSGNLYLRAPEGWTPDTSWDMGGGIFRLPVKLDGKEITINTAGKRRKPA